MQLYVQLRELERYLWLHQSSIIGGRWYWLLSSRICGVELSKRQIWPLLTSASQPMHLCDGFNDQGLQICEVIVIGILLSMMFLCCTAHLLWSMRVLPSKNSPSILSKSSGVYLIYFPLLLSLSMIELQIEYSRVIKIQHNHSYSQLLVCRNSTSSI